MKNLLSAAGITALVAALVLAFLLLRPGGDVAPTTAIAAAKAGTVLVDVRSPGERAQSAVPGTVHANWTEVVQALKAQGITPEQPVVLYCASGGRASVAAQALKSAGYKRVQTLNGNHGDLLRAVSATSGASVQ